MSRSREEAISAGITPSETKHQMQRRSPWHDYRKRGTYMLTLVISGRQPLLGRLVVESTVPCGSSHGSVSARVEHSPLGRAIIEEEIRKIAEHYPMVEVWRLCIMPDHIHMILRVKEDMPERKHLGQVVWGFKVGCTRAWWRLQNEGRMPCEKPQGTATAPVTSLSVSGSYDKSPAGSAPVPAGSASVSAGSASVPAGSSAGETGSSAGRSLFEPGYNDKILLREGQLENWKRYLDDNPRRLAVKRQHPDLFTVIHQAVVAGRTCQMVGNRFLLDIPQKMAVVVHSAYGDKEYADYREQWLACGEAGGVLVSAAIAPREKAVMREAMNRGYSIILLRENGFPPLYKPQGESFTACSEGRLLQISLWEYHMQRKTISREQCLQLNRMAEDIANSY